MHCIAQTVGTVSSAAACNSYAPTPTTPLPPPPGPPCRPGVRQRGKRWGAYPCGCIVVLHAVLQWRPHLAHVSAEVVRALRRARLPSTHPPSHTSHPVRPPTAPHCRTPPLTSSGSASLTTACPRSASSSGWPSPSAASARSSPRSPWCPPTTAAPAFEGAVRPVSMPAMCACRAASQVCSCSGAQQVPCPCMNQVRRQAGTRAAHVLPTRALPTHAPPPALSYCRACRHVTAGAPVPSFTTAPEHSHAARRATAARGARLTCTPETNAFTDALHIRPTLPFFTP